MNGSVQPFLILSLFIGERLFTAIHCCGLSTHDIMLSSQVFLLTVVFGLFPGLVFLPVLLSLAGSDNVSPDTKSSSSDAEASSEMTGSSSDEEEKAGVDNDAFVEQEEVVERL